MLVDSGSSDGTREIAKAQRNVQLFIREFQSHADQWNFGLTQTGIATDWVLALDADYLLDDLFISELRSLSLTEDIGGYRAAFRYCIYGKAIRCGTYPPSIILFRRKGARFVQDGHTQRVQAEGKIVNFRCRVDHDDRKSLARWLQSQHEYARLEAAHLERVDVPHLKAVDRLRVFIWPVPFVVFWYIVILRGGILDGWRGLYYALQRMYAELLLSLELLDRKLNRRTKG